MDGEVEIFPSVVLAAAIEPYLVQLMWWYRLCTVSHPLVPFCLCYPVFLPTINAKLKQMDTHAVVFIVLVEIKTDQE